MSVEMFGAAAFCCQLVFVATSLKRVDEQSTYHSVGVDTFDFASQMCHVHGTSHNRKGSLEAGGEEHSFSFVSFNAVKPFLVPSLPSIRGTQFGHIQTTFTLVSSHDTHPHETEQNIAN